MRVFSRMNIVLSVPDKSARVSDLCGFAAAGLPPDDGHRVVLYRLENVVVRLRDRKLRPQLQHLQQTRIRVSVDTCLGTNSVSSADTK